MKKSFIERCTRISCKNNLIQIELCAYFAINQFISVKKKKKNKKNKIK